VYCYTLQSSTISVAAPFTTSGTANTEVDFLFVKAGAGAKPQIYGLRLQGFGASLTALTGIVANLKNWTTASTAGTAMTPRPNSLSGAVVAQFTAGATPTAGSGGGTYRGGCGMSGSGPGAWTAANPDAYIDQAAGSAGSVDWYSLAPVVSMNFNWWMEVGE
jgi:hypothetical protein